MTPQELKALIESDQQAKTLMQLGNDIGCAARCSEIAPKIPKELRLSIARLLSLYQHNIYLGMAIVAKFRTVAAHNPLVAELLPFMEATADSIGYPDFSLPPIRQTLTTPEEQGGIGLTPEQALPILSAGEQSQVITPLEVEYVRTRL
jgi:hypothetical protein